MEKFQPQMIFISAGFEAHQNDEMAGLELVDADYDRLTREIKKIVDRFALGRIVSVLEGGYELHSLASRALAHLRVLTEE